MDRTIEKIIKESMQVKEGLLAGQVPAIEAAARLIIASLKAGGKVLVFGNGGSAADSQHMAAELVGRFRTERGALAAVALTTNTSTLTAIANDYGYDVVFSRQVEALGKPGDIAFGISTSGKSPNVLKALKTARARGMKAVGLAGGDGASMKGACDVIITTGSKDTPRVQESHITVIHILCELAETGMDA